MSSTKAKLVWRWLKRGSVFICAVGLLIASYVKKDPYDYYGNLSEIGWLLLISGVVGYIVVKVRGWISREESKVKIWSLLSLTGGVIFVLSLYKMWTLPYFRGGDIATDTSVFGLVCFIIGQIGVRWSHRRDKK